MITALSSGGIIYGYVQAGRRAEWSTYSLAGQSLAMQRIEQARACKWDPNAVPAVDELMTANFPETTRVLDVTANGAAVVEATISTEITQLSTDPPLKMITARCVWPFVNGRTYTNVITTYRGPDD